MFYWDKIRLSDHKESHKKSLNCVVLDNLNENNFYE